MVARIGTWHGTTDELKRWTERVAHGVTPKVAQQNGLVRAYWLVDREQWSGLTITIWDSEDAMRASERFREHSQAETSGATGAQVSTEHDEVVDHL